ncbi:MAG: hypothetical protein JW953_13380 [Anaerolineae bacterium]|nr:hypothetical protein [Anaerolineae bacterium]
MRTTIGIIYLIITLSLFIAACGTPPPPLTEWTPYESTENNITVSHPVTVEEVLEDNNVTQFQASEVHLAEGTLERPITILHFFRSKLHYLPEDIDPSDLEALVRADKDYYFLTMEDRIHELEPPQTTTFNGNPAAITVVNRIDPGKKDLYGDVDIVFYFAIIKHEDRLVRAQIQARKNSGGELLPYYAEKVLNSLEIH